MRALVLLALLIAGAAHADDFPATELLFDVALAADMATTADIKNHPGIHETNPILGAHPSDGKIAAYGACAGLIHAAITYEMVEHHAPGFIVQAWEFLGTAVEVGYAEHNRRLGLKLRF
jgi:hypothetical protein